MAIDTVIHTNQQSIDRVLNAGVPVVLFFWQEGIDASRQMDPALSDLAERYAGKALLAKIDASAEPQLVQQYGVKQIPTTVFTKQGKTEATAVGAIAKAELDAWLNYLVSGGARAGRARRPEQRHERQAADLHQRQSRPRHRSGTHTDQHGADHADRRQFPAGDQRPRPGAGRLLGALVRSLPHGGAVGRSTGQGVLRAVPWSANSTSTRTRAPRSSTRS